MSEDNADQTGEAPQEPQLDASFKVNADALSSEEADFARQMGFGDGGNEEGAEAKPAKAASAEPSPEPPTPTQANDVKASEDEADDSPTEVEEEAVAVTADESVGQVTEEAIDSDASATQMDWEEINPRSASEGIQSTLESRADELLGLESTSPGTSDGRAASNQTIAAVEQQCVTLQAQLDHRETELTQLRASLDAEIDRQAREGKELEELRVELDTLSLDRDQLIDQLALISGQLVQSKARNEKLDASLRAARGALTPLPEGERALRAEVIGLRGRLDEAREENHGISTQLSVSATDLAIARARVEDRQHEVHSQLELVEEAEARLAENEIQLKSTLGRHREMVAMTTRLQADNNELRSAQAALEETLEARDLEIVAREEHLTVTRQGLVARDLQLVDVNEILDQEQRRSEALTADLQRNRIHHDQLVHKVSHRESRIATLTETLARIEEAMGHPIPGPDSVAREMPEAEWTRPTLVPKAPSLEKMPPAPPTPTPTPVVAPSQATAPAEIVESEPMPETVIIEEPTERDAALPPPSSHSKRPKNKPLLRES